MTFFRLITTKAAILGDSWCRKLIDELNVPCPTTVGSEMAGVLKRFFLDQSTDILFLLAMLGILVMSHLS